MKPTIDLKDFLYHLPSDKIANQPNGKRDESKLLFFKKSAGIEKHIFNNISNLLPKKSNLIFNDSKVFPARLIFKKKSGSKIEIFCLESKSNITFKDGFYHAEWLCMVGNLKKWKEEVLEIKKENIILKATYITKINSENIIEFAWQGNENIFEVFEKVAELPLPPYMNRKANATDQLRYQTVYARNKGSVAAPTAGLHFTFDVLSSIFKNNHLIQYLTLHVGAGTFKPIKTTDIQAHEMHIEHFSVSIDLIQNIIDNPNVVAVGTTSMRVLESLYWIGNKLYKNLEFQNIHINQWDGFENDFNILNFEDSLKAILKYLDFHKLQFLAGTTSILIIPGYKFKICKGLVTNFHQPESTLILLVAAFVGEKWKEIYNFALENDFKFLSYGDSSLLLPND